MWFFGHRRGTERNAPRAPRDGGFDQSALVPDPLPWFEAWRDGSERARRRTPELRWDVSYGDDASERVDLYLPNHRPRNLPFAAFVHGNPWPEATRADAGYPAPAVHGNGAALVAVGYDAAADLATRVDQVRRAWAFLVTHGAGFGLDPARGHLMGHAAGALLAALAAFDPHAPAPPCSAVLLSGLYDLSPARRAGYGEAAALDEEAVRRLSPLHRVPRGGPRLAIAWGDRELAEYRRQSAELARVARARGLATRSGELSGRNHYDTSFELVNRHSDLLGVLRG